MLSHLINASLAEGYIHPVLKAALVRPLLMESSLESNSLKHYRPVSNLPFVSELLEKVVAAKLSENLNSEGLEEPFQSACRPHYSVETALIRV